MTSYKNWIKVSLVIALLAISCWGQTTADTGYTVPRSGFGLSLILGPGTCTTASGVIVSYIGTLINLTSNATNFGYLTSACAVTVNTTSFPVSSIPIFIAVTGVSEINTLTDSRTTYNFAGGGIGGSGTTNVLAKWISSAALGNSLVTEIATDPVEGYPSESCGTVPNATLANMCFYQTHNAFSAGLDAYTHDTTNTHLSRAPAINFFKSKGTQSSPGAIVTGDALGRVTFNGFNGVSYGSPGQGSGINSNAIENWVPGSAGSNVQIFATPISQTLSLLVVTFTGTTGPITSLAAFTGAVSPGAYLVGSLPTSAPANAGQMLTVQDSTAIAAEGQTCVGGSTNTALAFSNGVVWKCF